jgi:hypothetical protein
VVYAFMASKYLKRGTRREAVFAVLTLWGWILSLKGSETRSVWDMRGLIWFA